MAKSQHHRVRIDPLARQLDVVLELERDSAGDLELAVPTWVPGAYAFMKYGRNVFDVRAEDAATGAKLEVERRGLSGFVVKSAPASVVLRACVAASDAAWGELVGIIDRDVAVVHASHFPFDPAHRGPTRITFELPAGWTLHHPGGGKALGDQSFEHPHFASLVDTPIVAGRFHRIERKYAECTFQHVFTGKAVGFEREVESFVDDVMTVAEAAREVFGAFPMTSYTFVYATDPRASWGLEHGSSTLMAIGDAVFFDKEERTAALRLAAHELFHAWNVCRLKPVALLKPDLVSGSFPDGLWISEGFTRYYELLLTARIGALGGARFVSNLVRYDDALRVLPATKHVTLVDSSLATFLNHNRYPGSSSASIDYYDKGMVVAFVLDAALRTAKTPSTLDAALAAFYERFVTSGFDTPQAIEFFDRFASSLGTKEPIGPLLRRIVAGADMPDVAAALERMGFKVDRATVPHLGLWLKADRGPLVSEVAAGSPAALAGIGAGDELVSQNGFAFRADALRYLVRTGEPFTLGVRSGHVDREVTVTPAPRDAVASVSLGTTHIDLASWLGAGAETIAPGAPIPLTHYDNFHSREAML